jgi:hypothetical protein
MAIQRNVQQQNGAELERIRELVRVGADIDRVRWLHSLLGQQGKSPEQGALVRLHHVPEQEGDLYSGTWLDSELSFWEFVVVVARDSGAIHVERFEKATDQAAVTGHLPGKGKSFGQLAIQAFREQ